MWCIYTMKILLFSHKKNETLSFVTVWMNQQWKSLIYKSREENSGYQRLRAVRTMGEDEGMLTKGSKVATKQEE